MRDRWGGLELSNVLLFLVHNEFYFIRTDRLESELGPSAHPITPRGKPASIRGKLKNQ